MNWKGVGRKWSGPNIGNIQTLVWRTRVK